MGAPLRIVKRFDVCGEDYLRFVATVAATRAQRGRLRSRGRGIVLDDDEGPRPPRRRARPHLGEPVTKATIYGRARRAKLKAARASDAV
jgi:hypothetical protein